MKRAWTGLALLSGSWLFGLGYYAPANMLIWGALCLLAVALFGGDVVLGRLPERRDRGLAFALLLIPVWLVAWPYKAAPLLMALGLGVELAPLPWRRGRAWGRGALAAGMVLLVQGIALSLYADYTARSHELPWPLAWLTGGAARLLGADVAVDGNTLALHSLRQVHRLGATWDLLLDPPTLAFFVGGMTLLGLAAGSRSDLPSRWAAWLSGARRLTLVILAWLPVRAGLMIGLYLHRAMAADPERPLVVMNQFLCPWVGLILLAGPVLLALRFVRLPDMAEDESGPAAGEAGSGATQNRRAKTRHVRVAAVCAAGVLGAVLVQGDPVGSPKAGRVMVVERHSTWEPTTQPYSTTRYGELGSYNYAALFDYALRFFTMSRLLENEAIDDRRLDECDVLIVKTPTARYAPNELDAIERFVARGGGLLLVGDHTNVFKSSTYLNDLARRFGFVLRNDLLFHVGSAYDQYYVPPRAPHPAVAQVPSMWFAVSCSVDPGRSWGRAAVQNSGLWNLPPAYHNDNYHPAAQYRPEMRYGPFIQLWATRHGRGRVLAFTDSTIFSNFCLFQPGKVELMLNMIDWLNRQSPLDRFGLRLLVWMVLGSLAIALGTWGLRGSRATRPGWLAMLAAVVLGWVLGGEAVAAFQRAVMPPPEPKRPMTRVIVDRTVSEAPLARGAFNRDEMGGGFGLFEQWIGRLGYFTRRGEGAEAFSGDALVVISPNRSVSPEFRRRLVRYVAGGGRVLVVDSPANRGTTTNSLLAPFGMSIRHATARSGALAVGGAPTGFTVDGACEILGGQPLARVEGMSVAARARHGRGSVTVIGFGTFFNDAALGYTWMAEPDAEQLRHFELLFSLLRSVVDGTAWNAPEDRAASAFPQGAGEK